MKIEKIQHIGVPVCDIEKSIEFYTRLGFKKIMQENFQEKVGEGICVMMKSGDVVMELFQLPDEMLDDIRSRKDGHIDHITFDSKDIEKDFKEIKELGINTLQEAPELIPSFFENGIKHFEILGPDGEKLEFCEVL